MGAGEHLHYVGAPMYEEVGTALRTDGGMQAASRALIGFTTEFYQANYIQLGSIFHS